MKSGSIYMGILFVGILFLTWILTRITHFVFQKMKSIREGLYLRFFERLITTGILIGGVITAISVFGGFQSIWKTVLGGTAFISAVLIFAAQDTIKDILAGLMISIYKPFEIGNRVELENGTAGIVKDLTMRHVVLQLLDSQVLVVPNSKLNSMSIRNFSYHDENRAALLEYYIAYGSDVEKAIEVIRKAIMESPYSIPGKKSNDGSDPDYAPVYFLEYKESSLRLATTVYYEAGSPSEAVISDINLRVGKSLKEHGIEIPYPYINVVHVNGGRDANAAEKS